MFLDFDSLLTLFKDATGLENLDDSQHVVDPIIQDNASRHIIVSYQMNADSFRKVEPRVASATDLRHEVEYEIERPKSPWTLSYSVVTQGARTPDRTANADSGLLSPQDFAMVDSTLAMQASLPEVEGEAHADEGLVELDHQEVDFLLTPSSARAHLFEGIVAIAHTSD